VGKVLIFVTKVHILRYVLSKNVNLKKVEAEDVAKKLSLRDIELVLLHGDMHQMERNERITAFRNNSEVNILFCN
jgi:superfamily II DNA/RNA helicase